MEADQTHSFNEKLSQWIASQGFWFQLRHSLSGGGGWSMTFFHLCRLGLRVLIVAALAVGAFGIYLSKRTGGEAFQKGLEEQVAAALAADQVSIQKFGRSRGEAAIPRLEAAGGDASFFRGLAASGVRFRMGLFDGGVGTWKADVLRAQSLRVDLKAGADGPEQLRAMSGTFYRSWPGFVFSSVEVEQTDLSWGYSARTAGRIEGSRMVAIRSPGGWRLTFKGGTFSQNWLRKLAIEELVVDCRAGQIAVVTGNFRCGPGTVRFQDLAIQTGENPTVSGKVALSQVDLTTLLPDSVREFLEGHVSGELVVSGSTNSREGVVMSGQILLDGRSAITLREENLHLLKALSVVDAFHSYRKVEFDSGGFNLRSSGGSLELSSVDLTAGDLLTLQGALTVRPPTQQETEEAVGGSGGAPDFGPHFDPAPEAIDGKKLDDIAGSMKEAARLAAGKRGFERVGGDGNAPGLMEQSHAQEALTQAARAREIRNLRYEGAFRITLPGDAFDRAERLKSSFPKDPTGRIPMDVPIRGSIYDLTLKQAEDLLRMGSQR